MSEDEPATASEGTLFEAILDEQRAGWETGGRPQVEELLARHPSLYESHEAILDLIYQEYVIRLGLGESPQPEEYLRRFPASSDALIRQFAVDEALRSTPADRTGQEPATVERVAAAPAGPLPAEPPRTIEGFEILDEIGRGGMGVVYKAHERRLNRVVAIKTISEAAFASPAQRRRFLAEAEVIARIRHPHIIPIHAVGEAQGRPYFSLEFADGGSLAQRLAEGPLSIRQAAELVETLARRSGRSRGRDHPP